jgi:hypothetical protein
MYQPRCRQGFITLAPHFNELFLPRAVLEMLVIHFMLLNSCEWYRGISSWGRVIVSHPYLGLTWQSEELTARVKDCFGAAAGEVRAGRANVDVEDRVADKDVA